MRYAPPLIVVVLSVLAIAAWEHSVSLGWDLLFDGRPMVGMFGATARDLPRETAGETQARLRRDRQVLTELKWTMRGARASAALSCVGAIVFLWRLRRDSVRRRLPAASLALGALAVFVLVLVG